MDTEEEEEEEKVKTKTKKTPEVNGVKLRFTVIGERDT